MRILAFVLAVLGGTVLELGGVLVLVLLTPRGALDLVWLPVLALTVFLYGPLTVGSMYSYWDPRASVEAARYFRRLVVVVGALQVVGVVAIVVYAVLAGAPVWLSVVFVAVAVVLDLLAPAVGRALLRRDEERRPAVAAWQPVTHREIVRKVLAVAITFVGVLVVGAVLFSGLFGLAGRGSRPVTALLFALEFAFFTAALVGIVVALPLARRVRQDVSRDLGLLRRIAKVVLRGKRIDLAPDEQVAAAKYAVVIAPFLGFTLAYVLMLFVGLGLQRLQMAVEGRLDAQDGVITLLYVVLLLVVVPLQAVRIRRARAYAAAHAELLPQATGTV